MIFKDAWVLLFIPVVLLLVYWLKRRQPSSSLRFPSGDLIKGSRASLRLILAKRLFYSRAFVLVLMLLALARPRLPLEEAKVQTEGIDIVLALDCSGSMLAEDFKINSVRKNRLQVVKEVVKETEKSKKSKNTPPKKRKNGPRFDYT